MLPAWQILVLISIMLKANLIKRVSGAGRELDDDDPINKKTTYLEIYGCGFVCGAGLGFRFCFDFSNRRNMSPGTCRLLETG